MLLITASLFCNTIEDDRENRDDGVSRSRAPKEPEPVEEPAKLLDDLFKKTKAVPPIYWLPLVEEEAEKRFAERQEQERKRVEEYERRMRERDTRVLAERRPPPPPPPPRRVSLEIDSSYQSQLTCAFICYI